MFSNGPIILEGYGAAKFIAEMSYSGEGLGREYVPIYMKTKPVKNANGTISLEKNPNYPYKTIEEERIARYEYEQKKREFVLDFLRKNYPEKGYAERYDKENKWNKPLRFHNEKTKNCEYLDKDGRHCKKVRTETTCYTCCFSCTYPMGECKKVECKYIER